LIVENLRESSTNTVKSGTNGAIPEAQVPFDPFQMAPLGQALPAAQYNPYLEDSANITSNGAAYYQPQQTYTAPAQPVSFVTSRLRLPLTVPASISSLRTDWTSSRRPFGVPATHSRLLHARKAPRRVAEEIGSNAAGDA
jgi:hypothetical protein